jgi:hypothetical protein
MGRRRIRISTYYLELTFFTIASPLRVNMSPVEAPICPCKTGKEAACTTSRMSMGYFDNSEATYARYPRKYKK